MFKQRTLEEWNRFILRNATYGAFGAIGTTGKCNLKCEELKNLVIRRDSIREMSEEQIRELNSQCGWFSNDIEDFRDFNTLSKCHYDEPSINGFDLYSYYSEEDWEYFLPVKSLQRFIEVLKGAGKEH